MNSSIVKDEDPKNFSDWISQAEAARIRGLSQERIRQLVQNGRLQNLEVAGRKLVRRSEVESFTPKPEGRPRTTAAPKKAGPPKKDSPKKTAPKNKSD